MTNAKDWKLLQSEMANMQVDSVNALRNARDLTIKELAERLASYGWAVSVATLTGILSGRKRDAFTVAETMALARTLNVSPMYLILGLPHHSALPQGPLLGDEGDIGSVAAWFAGTYAMGSHPDDDTQRAPKTPEGFVESVARQGLQDLQDHTFYIRVVRWQAAQLIAAGEFPLEDVARALPPAVTERTGLWDAINGLLRTRDMQKRLGGWAIPLPPLPGWLKSIDVDPPFEISDPTTDELRSITTEPLIEQARVRIREALTEESQQRPGRRDVGDGQ